jgi:hypothetical protein
MAELLIIQGSAVHWYDRMTADEWQRRRAAAPDYWDRQVAMRWRDGDVVEIRPDGFWSQREQYPRRDIFRVVLVPGWSVPEAQYLIAEGQGRRRDYRVDSGAGAVLCRLKNASELRVTLKGLLDG